MLHRELAKDFTMPLISEIQVIDDPNYDCDSQSFGEVRLFEFWFDGRKLNGFPGGVTICARVDAPSWLESTCDSDERPHVCIKRIIGGRTTNDYCAKSEKDCPIVSLAAFESADPILD